MVTLLTALAVGREAHAAEVTLKVGTLATKSSPWGVAYQTWAKAVTEKSGGRLALEFFFNGAQGDEAAMVAKVKSGTLDGVSVSGVGLGKVYKPILALQMPGPFASWAKLDAARSAMSLEFDKGFSDAGFFNVGWCDIGVTRVFSKGFAIRVPTDFRGKKPFLWRDDIIGSLLYPVIGGVTPVPLNIVEVLPNLNTGAINALHTSALSAESLQWASKLDRI